jgi:hypothetical protein
MSPTLKCGEKRLTLYSLHVLAMFQHIQVISHVLPMVDQCIMCNHMELRCTFMMAFLLDLGHGAYYEFLTQLH